MVSLQDYFGDKFKEIRPLLEGPDNYMRRKSLYWFSFYRRYDNPELVWERHDIQSAIVEAKGTNKLVTVVATEVYRKMAEKQEKISENFSKLQFHGRQALSMNLDQI